MLSSIENILRDSINRKRFDREDVARVYDALNYSVLPLQIRETKDSKCGVVYSLGQASKNHTIRTAAEHLVCYLELFAVTPRLAEEIPLGICIRSGCGSLFYKVKSNKEYCSTKCREAVWRKAKGEKYYADKARESRDAKRKMKEKVKRRRTAIQRNAQTKAKSIE